MRSAEQIGRTVGEYHDFKRAERAKALRELLPMLKRAREKKEQWIVWLDARSRGEHLHGLKDATGKPVACPVRGCAAVRQRVDLHLRPSPGGTLE